MFGPNARPEYHHREERFEALLCDVEQLWRDHFLVPPGASVLFLTGSGTLAIEAVLNSLKPQHRVWVYAPKREFGKRLVRLANKHHRLAPSRGQAAGLAFVHYETGDGCPLVPPGGVILADCVSSFPYYDAPDAEVFVTVTSKQIGTSPGLSVVVVNEAGWARMKATEDEYSTFNLAEYRERWPQTPHTPAISLFAELREQLERFDLKRLRCTIDARRERLGKMFTPPDLIGTGPVFTILPAALPTGFAREWGLYRSHQGYQLFLWSGTDADYDRFTEALKKTRRR